jgi:hypothetical protein
MKKEDFDFIVGTIRADDANIAAWYSSGDEEQEGSEFCVRVACDYSRKANTYYMDPSMAAAIALLGAEIVIFDATLEKDTVDFLLRWLGTEVSFVDCVIDGVEVPLVEVERACDCDCACHRWRAGAAARQERRMAIRKRPA